MRRPTDTIDVVDPTGAIYTAIYGNLNIVVMDFDAPAVEPVATGTWTAVTYDELNEWTVLEDTSASFNTTVTAGDLVQPALWYSDWHEVASVLSASEIAVAGDLTGTIFPLVPYRVTDPIWSYSSGVSTYTNNSANFEDWMLGWLFTPDVNEPCYLQIIEVTSATSVKVKGDARGLSQPDDVWRIHAPPGVDNTTGGLHTDLTEAGSRYLYGSIRYMPPQAGFDISGTVYGAQPGDAATGFRFGKETYDPGTARMMSLQTHGRHLPGFLDANYASPFGGDWEKAGRWTHDCSTRCTDMYLSGDFNYDEFVDCLHECHDIHNGVKTKVRTNRDVDAIETVARIFLYRLEAEAYNEANPGWYDKLPPCPCEEPNKVNGNWKDADELISDGWASEGKNPYHPGSEVCYRSYPTAENGLTDGGPGQQCCYDAAGALITHGEGAGTPDRVGVAYGEGATGSMLVDLWNLYKHWREDVKASDALGWRIYNKYWPPNNGNKCNTNP